MNIYKSSVRSRTIDILMRLENMPTWENRRPVQEMRMEAAGRLELDWWLRPAWAPVLAM